MKPVSLTIMIVLSALAMFVRAGQMYRWTDENGKVFFSDQAPPSTAKNVSQKTTRPATPEEQLPLAMKQAQSKFPLVLFTSANCGQPCDLAKSFLDKRALPYATKDPGVDKEARNQLTDGGAPARVPALMVGSRRMDGFNESTWNVALDAAGYPSVISSPPAK